MDFFSVDSPCGDWFAFKDEKCFMVFEEVGFRTFKEEDRDQRGHRRQCDVFHAGGRERRAVHCHEVNATCNCH